MSSISQHSSFNIVQMLHGHYYLDDWFVRTLLTLPCNKHCEKRQVETGIKQEYPTMIYHIYPGIIQDETWHFSFSSKYKFIRVDIYNITIYFKVKYFSFKMCMLPQMFDEIVQSKIHHNFGSLFLVMIVYPWKKPPLFRSEWAL